MLKELLISCWSSDILLSIITTLSQQSPDVAMICPTIVVAHAVMFCNGFPRFCIRYNDGQFHRLQISWKKKLWKREFLGSWWSRRCWNTKLKFFYRILSVFCHRRTILSWLTKSKIYNFCHHALKIVPSYESRGFICFKHTTYLTV